MSIITIVFFSTFVNCISSVGLSFMSLFICRNLAIDQGMHCLRLPGSTYYLSINTFTFYASFIQP